MAQNTVTALSNFLKTRYFEGIMDQLAKTIVLYSLFQRGKEDIEGKSLQATFALKDRGNQGIGWRNESGVLPSAGAATYKNGVIALKYLYAAVDFTAQALHAAKSSAGAFANLLQEAMMDLVERATIEVERSLMGTGSGDMALFNHTTGLVTAGTAIGVDSPGAVALERGMIVESWSARSGGTQQSPFDNTNTLDYATITNVDPIANTIKFGVDVNVTNNYYLYRTDGTTSSRNKVMMGLRGALDHAIVSTFEGIDRSAGNQEWWRANVVDASSNALTLSNMISYIWQTYINGGGVVDLILTSEVQRRNFLDIFIADRRYAPKDILINGQTYTSFLSGNREIPIAVSRFMMPDQMMFLQRDVWKIHELGFDWIQDHDAEGTVLWRTSNKHDYTAYLFNWLNLSCSACNRNTIVQSLATT